MNAQQEKATVAVPVKSYCCDRCKAKQLEAVRLWLEKADTLTMRGTPALSWDGALDWYVASIYQGYTLVESLHLYMVLPDPNNEWLHPNHYVGLGWPGGPFEGMMTKGTDGCWYQMIADPATRQWVVARIWF